MKCPKCSTEYEGSSCPNCGAAAQPTESYPEHPENKPKKKGCLSGVLTFILVILIISAIGSCTTDDSESADQPTSTPPAQTTEENSPAEAETEKNSETEEVKLEEKQLSEEEKTAIREIDRQIYELIVHSETINTNLKIAIDSAAQGQFNVLDLYDLIKDGQNNQSAIYSSLLSLKDDTNKDYIYAAQSYVSNSKEIASKLLKYLDKNEIKYLSEAKERIEKTDSYVLTVVTARMKYLSDMGFSDEEIVQILGESADQDAN